MISLTSISRLSLLALVLYWTATPQVRADQESGQLISVKFAGGTALEYVNTVRRAAGELNIVIPSEAAEVQMPAVTLTQVSPAAALDLLDGREVVRPTGKIRLRLEHQKVYDLHEQPTYRVITDIGGRGSATEAHVWSVAGLLDNGIPSASVLSAVEMALDVVGSKTKLDVRFHQETGLLIATGDKAQLEVIDEVVARLNDIIDERLQNPLRELETALEGADGRLNETIAELAETREARKEAQDDLMHMQMELQRMEMQMMELRRMLDRKEHELRELQRREPDH